MLDDDFLARFRASTERSWATGGGQWRAGTRWTGGTDVDALERRLGVRFADDHRRFLATLHSTWPYRFVTRYEGERRVKVEAPGFYDWNRDADAIAAACADVLDGLVFDVEANARWLESWGARPATADARAAHVTALVAAAPRLFPIFGHRFVVEGTPGVVLSVYQREITVYGANLREYLRNELADLEMFEVSDGDFGAIPFWGELIR